MPEIGVWKDPKPLTAAAPRRKAKGEAAMRSMRRDQFLLTAALPATTKSAPAGRCLGRIPFWRDFPAELDFAELCPLHSGIGTELWGLQRIVRIHTPMPIFASRF